jgi:hypothetical protein
MIVGNPSSNKTTLVDLLSELVDVYKLDSLTSNPFSSGQREKEKPQDLLPLLNGKCFVIKEYATLFGRSDEMIKQLISDLVAIYDGEFAKHSPTRGTVRHKSYFSHIGCVTPMALNNRQGYMSSVGARFLFLKIEPLSSEERENSLDKIWEEKPRVNKDDVAAIVTRYCLRLKEKVLGGCEVKFTGESKVKLQSLAHLTARARGIVITEKTSFQTEDGSSQSHYEVVDIQVEEPFRALKQIKKLAKCLAIVSEHEEVGEEEVAIVRRVVLSSMPVRRADILSVFETAQIFTAKTAAKALEKNQRTVKRNLDELVALGVLKSSKEENDLARHYSLRPEFTDLFNPPPMGTADTAALFGAEVTD